MYFSGTSIILDVACAMWNASVRDPEEISHKIWCAENENEKLISDIIRLPLKLTFPSLPIKQFDPKDYKYNNIINNDNIIENFYEDNGDFLADSGPYDDNLEIVNYNSPLGIISSQSISTYPNIPIETPEGEPQRYIKQGEPICDRFSFCLLPQRQILVIADGCNWGDKPKTAAIKASNTFLNYLYEHQHEVNNTHYAARLISRAFALAHNKILENAEAIWMVGTTTLLGGLVVELDEPEEAIDKNTNEKYLKEWSYIYGSVGDCKLYLYSPRYQTFHDMSATNRMYSDSATDCGGRLGPTGKNGDECAPDLRNFRIDYFTCEKDDILILVTDGVHDNLEPMHLGLTPEEIYPYLTKFKSILCASSSSSVSSSSPNIGSNSNENNNCISDWKELDPISRSNCQIEFGELLLQRLLLDDQTYSEDNLETLYRADKESLENRKNIELTPEFITKKLIEHCVLVNTSATNWMCSNTGKKLPQDYQLYPGKMDHTTCISFKVGSCQPPSTYSTNNNNNNNSDNDDNNNDIQI
eukprot:TRINITY_DN1040_c1_g2_i1.p1 TRINITY_DN1040_c1_g2~~TRINITY_DN1040_c1_g2_i1.p1  ORF type:complete len:528 (-),score=160.83 TRINITY_DN1040_c1_g2_i1:166-1749(-)